MANIIAVWVGRGDALVCGFDLFQMEHEAVAAFEFEDDGGVAGAGTDFADRAGIEDAVVLSDGGDGEGCAGCGVFIWLYLLVVLFLMRFPLVDAALAGHIRLAETRDSLFDFIATASAQPLILEGLSSGFHAVSGIVELGAIRIEFGEVYAHEAPPRSKDISPT